MAVEIVLAKAGNGSIPAGVTEVVGLNANALPGADTTDGAGITLYQGLHPHEVYDVTFNRNAQDLTFYFEGQAYPDATWRPICMYRYDTGTVVTNVTLGATGGLLVVPGGMGLGYGLHGVRIRAYLAAADVSADAYVIVRSRKGR
jgi:hypothetical protein